MKEVYIVLIGNAEGDMLLTPAYSTYDKAYKRWVKEKEKLSKKWTTYLDDRYSLRDCAIEQIEKLKETDPKKINCYPHDTPYINKVSVV